MKTEVILSIRWRVSRAPLPVNFKNHPEPIIELALYGRLRSPVTIAKDLGMLQEFTHARSCRRNLQRS